MHRRTENDVWNTGIHELRWAEKTSINTWERRGWRLLDLISPVKAPDVLK